MAGTKDAAFCLFFKLDFRFFSYHIEFSAIMFQFQTSDLRHKVDENTSPKAPQVVDMGKLRIFNFPGSYGAIRNKFIFTTHLEKPPFSHRSSIKDY